MDELSKIEVVGIERLLAHPENPNKMNGADFLKLRTYIGRSGNYEPIVVRVHPDEDGCYQIINGHHRVKALGELGYEKVNCVVWDVDDVQCRVLLASINRLKGRDILGRRAEIVLRLLEDYSVEDLSCVLPDKTKQIEALRDAAIKKMPKLNREKNILKRGACVFLLDECQRSFVKESIGNMKRNVDGLKGASDSEVLMFMCERYIGELGSGVLS